MAGSPDHVLMFWGGARLHTMTVAMTTLHPVLWAVLGAVVSVFAVILFLRLYDRNALRRKDREMSHVVSRFIEERSNSETILADLDIGVIAYGGDGLKVSHNPEAERMLAPDAIPPELKTFAARYGQTNGIQAALLLGNESIAGTIQHSERILRLRLKESRLEESRRPGRIVIIQDITEQDREERKRKDFVANVSHELKTPLTTINTYSESLLDWGLAEKTHEAVRKDIRRIHDDSLRMGRLVDDLLLLSSIDSRGKRFRLELLDLAQTVRQVVDRMQHQAADKKLEMTCFALSRMPLVFVDRTAIERIMTNLVGNAIKYTDKGMVKVYFGHIVDEVYIKVSDTGSGIAPDHLPHIFDRFYRVDMTGSRMFGGTGLGLSIARELVDLHDGKINVVSHVGKGSEFTVMLPTAEKVFRDALEASRLAIPPTDIVRMTASEELLQAARALRISELRLDQLSEAQASAVMAHVLARDLLQDAEIDAVTREFEPVADPVDQTEERTADKATAQIASSRTPPETA